jgi:hypothetical protein
MKLDSCCCTSLPAELPVIEKILAHLGLDPQPPPKGRRVREAGLHFAA